MTPRRLPRFCSYAERMNELFAEAVVGCRVVDGNAHRIMKKRKK